MCKPLFSILKWWKTYAKDTLRRLIEFDALRTDTYQISLTGDNRSIDILEALREKNFPFYEIVSAKKIKGIFHINNFLAMSIPVIYNTIILDEPCH
jgi:hypothetical protein